MSALVAATAALALADSASAATVRMDRVVETDEGETSVYGNVYVTAGAGEVNSLMVQVFPAHASGPGAVVVTDEKAPPTAGAV